MISLVDTSKRRKKFWNYGLDSSSLLSQNLIDEFGDTYIKRNLTHAKFNKERIIVPMIQYFPLQPTRKMSYPPFPNPWRKSTYHLIEPFRTGMIYVPPVYAYRLRNGKLVRN